MKWGDNHAWGDHRITLDFDKFIEVSVRNTRPDNTLAQMHRTTEYEFNITSDTGISLTSRLDPTDPGDSTYTLAMYAGNTRMDTAISLWSAIRLHTALMFAIGVSNLPSRRDYYVRIESEPMASEELDG